MNKYIPLLLLVGCTQPAPAPAPSTTVTLVETAPDDQGPQERKLAQETKAHASASAPPPAVEKPFLMTQDGLGNPEGHRWQDAGVLVVFLGKQEDAVTPASSLRGQLSRNGAGAWVNAVDAIHVYQELWVTRVSMVNELESKRLCAWLDLPGVKGGHSWFALDKHRECRFSVKPMLTTKTEYTILRATQ